MHIKMISVIQHIQLSNMPDSRSGRISDNRLYFMCGILVGLKKIYIKKSTGSHTGQVKNKESYNSLVKNHLSASYPWSSWSNKIKNKKFQGSRQTRLEAEFPVSVGTPPAFQDQGADAAAKAVGGE